MKQEYYKTYILNKEFGVIKEERNSINFNIKNNKDNHIKDKDNFYKNF